MGSKLFGSSAFAAFLDTGVGLGVGEAFKGALKEFQGNAKLPKQPPPTQTAIAPTGAYRAGMTGTGQSGGQAGVSQTFLAGPSGVDPSTLNIGRNTLLGG